MPTAKTDEIGRLNKLFASALRALGDAGVSEQACELAAEGWSCLRETHPKEAERLNGVLHYLTRDRFKHTAKETQMAQDQLLDVRALPPAQRHTLIFETYEKLEPGAGFVLVNDHDPKPLYYQFAAEQPNAFTWKYLEEGPEVWRVRIGRTPA